MISLKKRLCLQLITIFLLFPLAGHAAKNYKKETAEERRVRVGMCSQRCFLTEKRCKYTTAEDVTLTVAQKEKAHANCIAGHDICVKECDTDLYTH